MQVQAVHTIDYNQYIDESKILQILTLLKHLALKTRSMTLIGGNVVIGDGILARLVVGYSLKCYRFQGYVSKKSGQITAPMGSKR